MALKMLTKPEPEPKPLPEGADRFLWDEVPPPPAKKLEYAQILKKPIDK